MKRKAKRDVAQTITNLIVSRIEAGTVPWRRPWTKTAAGPPLRANGVRYTGINSLYLWAVAETLGYDSKYWMTYRQAQELGGQVRKGEKSEPSIYFNATSKNEIDEATGEETNRTIRFMRAYSVFNASQIEGLPGEFYDKPQPAEPLEPSAHRTKIASFFDPIPIEVRHGGSRAYYSPGQDFIQLPNKERFSSEDAYAAVRAHETVHATGHAKRLGRKFGKRFGDKAYAAEELVADMGSCAICYELGLPNELHDSHASYIEGWLSIMKADKNALITAAAKAEQAFNYLAQFSDFNRQEERISHAQNALPAHA